MAPADETKPTDDADDSLPTDEGDDVEQAKTRKKKKIIIAAAGLLGLLVIVGGISYFMGWLNPLLGIHEGSKTAEIQLGAPISFELPQIKADLKTGQCRAPFLRTTISVQLSENDVTRLQNSQEKLMDQIIIHLRDQERQDLVGKAGSNQLRFDLVNIINNVISPARIFGITFKEFVLQ